MEQQKPGFANPAAGFQQSYQGAPEWLQQYLQQNTQGFEDVTDVYNRMQPQIANTFQQYGQESFFNPAFLAAGRNDFKAFDPFSAQNESGSLAGGFNWSWNPFQGLTGVNEGLSQIGHYATHGKAAMKGAARGNENDVNFYNRFGGSGSEVEAYGSTNWEGAHGRAMDTYNQLLAIQQKYGGY